MWPRGRRFRVGALLGCLLIVAACGDPRAPSPATAVDYPPWTLIVLPDTQHYMARNPDIWFAQANWISEYAREANVRFIAHVGDVTNGNTEAEWQVARRGLDVLQGAAPFVLVPGNHDYDDLAERSSRQSAFWSVDEVRAAPTFGGLFESSRTDNSYQRFVVNQEQWLVLALEWGPRDAVLEWAAGVLDEHPDHKVILVTHAFLYSDNTRYDWVTHGASQKYSPHFYVGPRWPDVNDGEEIWQKLIAPRDNVELVVCGHVPGVGVGRLTSPAANGRQVHQVLANFQSGPMGGNGYLRVMKFHHDRIDVSTYSPYLDSYDRSDKHNFSLSRSRGSGPR